MSNQWCEHTGMPNGEKAHLFEEQALEHRFVFANCTGLAYFKSGLMPVDELNNVEKCRRCARKGKQ